MHIGFSWGNLTERDHLKDPGLDGKIKWIFETWDGRHGLERSGSRQGHVAGSCE
jgi:hypothetical protein